MRVDVLTATITDRLRNKRAIRIELVVNSLIALLLPWTGSRIAGAFIGLFLLSLTSEFVIKSSLPVMAEIMPKARAPLMGFTVAACLYARATGALISPALYQQGFLANAAAAFFLFLAACFFLRDLNIRPPQQLLSDEYPG